MPVIKETGPLPPDHPFAGTRIVFVDALMKRGVQEQLARDQDPMREAEEIIEQALRSRCSPPANDPEDGEENRDEAP